MKLSLIIAIYNRKEELTELLHSLAGQSCKYFEVVVIDDGSQIDLSPVITQFSAQLDLHYYKKENKGPGLARNFGTKKASGDFFIFLDSDCIAPQNYIENILTHLETQKVDAFGGADLAHKDFNTLQKAISYSMTSVLTTGGIRGKEKSVTKFQPRSFNMGVTRNAFETVGGFKELRIGEDPDLSMRLWENGFSTAFFSSVKVFHKRRNSLGSFVKQVYQFGAARPILNKRHPDYVKAVFWFPTLFVLCLLTALFLTILPWLNHSFNFATISINNNSVYFLPILLFITYFALILIHSTMVNKNIKVGIVSILTSLLQHCGYGYGFFKSYVLINIFKRNPKEVFPSHYYH